MPENRVLPGNLPSRTRTQAAIVPRTVAIVELASATRTVTQAASRNASFASSSPYHFVEKPAQTVTSFEALKL